MDYTTASEKLTGRNLDSRKLANNTYLKRHDEFIAVKLHDTEIVKFYPDGLIVLTSGGWKTATTKERLNAYSGYRVSQSNSIWYVLVDGKSYVFKDDMTINKNGKVEGTGVENLKADKKIKAGVKKYAELCASKLPLDKPSGGDCWYCLMKTEKGVSLGDCFKDTDHIKSHIEDGYIVPSLVFNAMVESGLEPQRNIQFSLVFDNPHSMLEFAQDTVKRTVYKYILKRLGYAL